MTIQYLGRYHSEDDPGGLVREVVELGPDFPGSARDLLLSWVLRLDAGKDPAEAAKRLLKAYGIAEGPVAENACGELIGLLRETARYGLEKLRSRYRPGSQRPSRRRPRRGY